jgi:hypothetical protein
LFDCQVELDIGSAVDDMRQILDQAVMNVGSYAKPVPLYVALNDPDAARYGRFRRVNVPIREYASHSLGRLGIRTGSNEKREIGIGLRKKLRNQSASDRTSDARYKNGFAHCGTTAFSLSRSVTGSGSNAQIAAMPDFGAQSR